MSEEFPKTIAVNQNQSKNNLNRRSKPKKLNTLTQTDPKCKSSKTKISSNPYARILKITKTTKFNLETPLKIRLLIV